MTKVAYNDYIEKTKDEIDWHVIPRSWNLDIVPDGYIYGKCSDGGVVDCDGNLISNDIVKFLKIANKI